MYLKKVAEFFMDDDYSNNYYNLLIHFLKIIIASVIASVGLGTNDSNMILGTMLISPLSAPLSAMIYHIYYNNNYIKIFRHLSYVIIDMIIMFIVGYIFTKNIT